MTMRFTTKLLPSLSGNLGVLQLNNSKALHALTLDMIDAWSDTLDQWYHPNSRIRAILVKASSDHDDDGGGGRKRPFVFCAGGDVKTIYQSLLNEQGIHGQGNDGLVTSDFYRREYAIDYRLATSKKIPQISLWNGIVMGGGVGISVFGKYRVATENSVLAMPECLLGLFPDVGSLFWMPRTLKGGLPAYLALTGYRCTAEDLMYTGIATHYVPSDQLDELERALVDASIIKDTAQETFDPFAAILMKFHEMTPVDPRDSFLAKQRAIIDDVFTITIKDAASSLTMEGIMAKLDGMKSQHEFAHQTLETLKKCSPTSLKITLEGLKRGSAVPSLGEDLQMEFRLAQSCMRSKTSDFVEGVRATLIDKDKNPKWNPSTLEEVTDEMVESYFKPVEQEWLIPPPTDAESTL